MPKAAPVHTEYRTGPYTPPLSGVSRTPLKDSTRRNIPVTTFPSKSRTVAPPAIPTANLAAGVITLPGPPQWNERDETIPLPLINSHTSQIVEVKYPLGDSFAILRVQLPPCSLYSLPLEESELHHLLLHLQPIPRAKTIIHDGITAPLDDFALAPTHFLPHPEYLPALDDGPHPKKNDSAVSKDLPFTLGEHIIPENATSFLDIQLPTMPGSELPPIYDTCTQVRMKINKLMNNKNPDAKDAIPGELLKSGKPKPWTQAAFCHAIGNVNPSSYSNFMKSKTAMGGGESGVYSGAYIFFEKKRIWEGKVKTEARKKYEEENPMGLALEDHSAQTYVTNPIVDKGTVVQGKRMVPVRKSSRLSS